MKFYGYLSFPHFTLQEFKDRKSWSTKLFVDLKTQENAEAISELKAFLKEKKSQISEHALQKADEWAQTPDELVGKGLWVLGCRSYPRVATEVGTSFPGLFISKNSKITPFDGGKLVGGEYAAVSVRPYKKDEGVFFSLHGTCVYYEVPALMLAPPPASAEDFNTAPATGSLIAANDNEPQVPPRGKEVPVASNPLDEIDDECPF